MNWLIGNLFCGVIILVTVLKYGNKDLPILAAAVWCGFVLGQLFTRALLNV